MTNCVIVGTKLLLNIRFDQCTTMARQGDKMLRLLCFNFAEDSAANNSSNKPPSSGGSSSQQGLDAVGMVGTSVPAAVPAAVVLTPQTYLLKTKDSKVSLFFVFFALVILKICLLYRTVMTFCSSWMKLCSAARQLQ